MVHLALADKFFYVAMDKLSKKYGGIMSLKMGLKEAGKEQKKLKLLLTLIVSY